MADSVRAILSRLESISSRVTRRPLGEEELQAIEKLVGMPMPSAVREYLGTVGLFQDLVSYDTSEFEVLEDANDFQADRRILVEQFGAAAQNLFPFGGDGAGDIIAVAEGPDGGTMYFADHETHKIRKLGSFCDWLSVVVETALKQDRPANTKKTWCVQFTFRAPSPDPILAVMREVRSVELGQWGKENKFPSGVRSSEAPLAFGGEQLILKRSEFWTWEQPMFALDYHEPVDLAAATSMIRKLGATFAKAKLGYKLVDYGPLALDERTTGSDERPDTERKNKPWWRFW